MNRTQLVLALALVGVFVAPATTLADAYSCSASPVVPGIFSCDNTDGSIHVVLTSYPDEPGLADIQVMNTVDGSGALELLAPVGAVQIPSRDADGSSTGSLAGRTFTVIANPDGTFGLS